MATLTPLRYVLHIVHYGSVSVVIVVITVVIVVIAAVRRIPISLHEQNSKMILILERKLVQTAWTAKINHEEYHNRSIYVRTASPGMYCSLALKEGPKKHMEEWLVNIPCESYSQILLFRVLECISQLQWECRLAYWRYPSSVEHTRCWQAVG